MNAIRIYTASVLWTIIVGLGTVYGQNFTWKLTKTIRGKISPKSIVRSPSGLFYAQNMMYFHTVTVYSSSGTPIKTIADGVYLKEELNDTTFSGLYKGAPVEIAFSPDSNYAWVSNYRMYGQGFETPGDDDCGLKDTVDQSYLYKINCTNHLIEAVVKVGSVPKYLAVTPDNHYVLVSNWCSGTVSVVDTKTSKQVKEVYVGRHPRGIAIDSSSKTAYVTVMGERKIAKINLSDFKVSFISNIGAAPRHICLDSRQQHLYISLGNQATVIKYDLNKKQTIGKVKTGRYPRTMVLNEKDQLGYVVNYGDSTFSVFNLNTMKLLKSIKVGHHPIGITYDPENHNVWVACYSGAIKIYQQSATNTSAVAASRHPVAAPKYTFETKKMEPGVGKYHIVVGCYGEPKNIQRQLVQWKKKGYLPYTIPHKNNTFLIAVNSFEKLEDAQLSREKISKENKGTWIYKVK